ncbi:MAG: PDZ domain-containing protein [Bacilli bacterium]|nr:PDZ domain-containing protein [Bacilli bacterium]
MFTKVYDKVKQFLSNEWKFFLLIVVISFITMFEFPYYIDTPGGLLDVSDRIEIKDSYSSKGSFNLAYVSELKATIPTLFIAWLHPDWDILKEEDVLYDNETMKDLMLRDQLLLQEAVGNATIVGYQKAGKELTIKNEKVYVGYVLEEAETTLKVGDQILEVNGIKVENKEQLSKLTQTFKKGETIELKVLYEEKEKIRTATLKEVDGRILVGIILTQISEVETNPEIEFHFKKSESGPSGGLMTALSIYNMLTEEDLTKGKRIVGTGTIELDGTVGSIGGVKYKLKGAVNKKAEIFFVPAGENYEEAMKLKEKNNYKIEIISISNIDDAINYLKNL